MALTGFVNGGFNYHSGKPKNITPHYYRDVSVAFILGKNLNRVRLGVEGT